jgi:hypothetical protein
VLLLLNCSFEVTDLVTPHEDVTVIIAKNKAVEKVILKKYYPNDDHVLIYDNAHSSNLFGLYRGSQTSYCTVASTLILCEVLVPVKSPPYT